MTKRLFSTIIFLAVSASLPAQEPQGWAYKLISDDGKPTFGHDFGVVAKGTQLHKTFSISNIYAVPLAIQTGVSCDCVTVTVSKQVLNPKEKGEIDIVMDTRRFDGPKAVNVFVTVTQAPPPGQRSQYTSGTYLKVSANCRTDVTLNPGSVSFGIVPRGQQPQVNVDVDYAGRLDWQITGKPKSDLFDVDVVQRVRAPGRVGYQIQMKLKEDAPAGSYKQDLTVSTNDPASPTVAIPFELTVQPALAVAPELVRITGSRVGAESTARFMVRSGGRPFKVMAIDGQGDGLTVMEAAGGESKPVHSFTIKFTPTQPGPTQRKLTIKTDGDKSLTAVVTVEATVNNP